MTNIELYTEAVLRSISGANPRGITSWEDKSFFELAVLIVEPYILNIDAEQEYCDFLEHNPENWANWIRQNFGKDWGKIAKVISVEGY